MSYFKHLIANWRVAIHSLNDFFEHFLHGILPFIKWNHYEEKFIKMSNKLNDKQLLEDEDYIISKPNINRNKPIEPKSNTQPLPTYLSKY